MEKRKKGVPTPSACGHSPSGRGRVFARRGKICFPQSPDEKPRSRANKNRSRTNKKRAEVFAFPIYFSLNAHLLFVKSGTQMRELAFFFNELALILCKVCFIFRGVIAKFCEVHKKMWFPLPWRDVSV